MSKLKQLRNERSTLATQARALISGAEGKEWTTDNQSEYDNIVAQIEGIDKKIEREEQVLQFEASTRQSVEGIQAQHGFTESVAQDALAGQNILFAAFLRGGQDGVRAAATQHRNNPGVQAAMTTGTGTEGGYTVPTQFGGTLIERIAAYGGLRTLAQVITTDHGIAIPFPTVDATGQEGEIVGENVAVSAQEIAFGTLEIGTYKYSSKSIAVPFELLTDSGIDIENYILNLLAGRLSRITNKHFVMGTGVGQPAGIVTKASQGYLSAVTAAISFDDLIELEHSVNPAYRAGGNVGYSFNDNTLKLLRKLKDADGRPLFQPGVESAAYNTINNRRYAILQEMDDVAAGKKPVLFGDFSNYVIRDVRMDTQLFRMTDSKYTELGQVGFLSFSRHGGGCIDEGARTGGSGAHSVKYMKMAAA